MTHTLTIICDDGKLSSEAFHMKDFRLMDNTVRDPNTFLDLLSRSLVATIRTTTPRSSIDVNSLNDISVLSSFRRIEHLESTNIMVLRAFELSYEEISRAKEASVKIHYFLPLSQLTKYYCSKVVPPIAYVGDVEDFIDVSVLTECLSDLYDKKRWTEKSLMEFLRKNDYNHVLPIRMHGYIKMKDLFSDFFDVTKRLKKKLNTNIGNFTFIAHEKT